jgi:sulfur-carrier protein adenylyltransferase/sulfurtransferase
MASFALPQDFSSEEMLRYSRQMLMPEVGPDGQAKLKEASVLCVGAGGLGSPLLLYLAAAGVGRIGIVDFDRVDRSNLHRQVLYGDSDEGRPKLERAADKLADINPNVELELFEGALTFENAERIVEGFDVVADGTDNFPARYAISEACVRLGKPNVHGAVFRFDGQVSVFDARRGPCYRCIFPQPPPPGAAPSCAEAGVLGVLPGVIGCLQATEAIKLILGVGEPLVGRILLVDALTMRFQEVHVAKDPQCPGCGPEESRQPIEVAASACEAPGTQPIEEVGPAELHRALQSDAPPFLLDVREPVERAISAIEGDYHVPMDDVPERLAELNPGADIVVYCRSGVRSRTVAQYLRSQGFQKVRNLAGGINAYAREVAPELSQY